MDEAAKKLSSLIDRFQNNLDAYRSPAYNETQLRIEFIDPFFEALGWDVANKAGYAEQYKDVIHEDAIKVSGATKAPDYCFRIGGVRKFFLETKKPSIDIKDQVGPAYQLRRYAWSAKLPLSILTNFAELAIYDCRSRPKPADKTSIGRVRFYPYTEYIKSIEEIYNLLSKESVLKGSFDKFAETDRQKRGTTEVDSEFLKEIENWREILAKDIARRNPKLSVRELNYAVQLTIDRIIFLRMCEDRGIESYGQIQSLLNGTNTYHRLREFFYHADGKYNSGLFDFKADQLTPDLKIDDHPLKDIFKYLYYPDSPYEFSVLGADILGHVYEQFLGKVIRLTGGHQAKVEEKPEVRKAGGVYYTPTYVVDYIVKNTIRIFCEGKSPKQISSLRILDPACGSGSFLLGAYQYLLDYHREWYQKDGCKKRTKEIYQGRGGQWYLTIQEKKRILLNNIYGVDIDPQAVEVTKLSLLLKVLEGENQDTLEKQMKLFNERALPDLGSNIKCGNSLIASDFYNTQLTMNFIDEEKRFKLNAFDWNEEFAEITKTGGFNIVIGNPPWGAEYSQEEKEYFRTKYEIIHVRTPESFNYFLKQMWDCTGKYGIIGVIIPGSFLNQHEFWKTRKYFVESSFIYRVCNLGDGVFSGVTAPSCIIVCTKQKDGYKSVYSDLRKIPRIDLPSALMEERGGTEASQIGQNSESFVFQIHSGLEIIKKCYTWPTLKNIAEDVATGISSGLDAAYVFNPDNIEQLKLEDTLLRKLIIGGEIHRYLLTPRSGKEIIYITPEDKIENYPNCFAALLPYRDRLKKRREAANGQIPWFSLNWPRRKKLFDEPKILIRQTADRILAAFDPEEWYCLKSAIIVQLKEKSETDNYKYLLKSCTFYAHSCSR
jgi:type I restriction-modification system DNA methylase subunit